MNYTQEQFDKLPKWAQSEIRRLQSDADYLDRRLKEFSGEASTNTFILDMLDKMPIQKNANVQFRTGENMQNRIEVRIKGENEIYVNADSGVGHKMAIAPDASNAFTIRFYEP